MGVNIFSTADVMANFDKGYEAGRSYMQDFRKGRAAFKAAPKIAAGDYRGAAGAYAEQGLADETATLAGAADKQDQQMVANRRQAEQDQMARGKQIAEAYVSVADGLEKQFADPAQRRQAFLSHPLSRTLPADQLASLTDADFSNENLQLFKKQVQLEIIKGSDGYSYTAVDPTNGAVVASQRAPKEYKPEWKERKRADGSSEWFDINGGPPPEAAPAPEAPQPSRAMTANPDQIVAPFVQQGARVTSAVRTPERNAAVGGVPNSYHLASRGGLARDLAPPQGVSMGQFHQQVRQGLPPGWEAINEGDHIHIEPSRVQVAGLPGAPMGRGSRTVQGDAPQTKPRTRPATAEEKAAYGIPADVPAKIDEKGDIQVISGAKPGSDKPLTEYQSKAVELLDAAFGGNERLNALAKAGIYKPSTATDSLFSNEKDGTKRLILRSEQDRQFVQAAKEWLAPILRKESGASVTDGELATFMDVYVPKFEDSPATLWQKAQARDRKMRSMYTANRQNYDPLFGSPGKWQVLTDPRAAPRGASRPSAQAQTVRTSGGITVKVSPIVGN